MGLFSSSKRSSEPLPVLHVNLTTPQDKVFHPNEHITGFVNFSTPTSLRPTALEVSFWGNSSIWIRRSSGKDDYTHYRDNVSLFNVSYNLLSGQDMHPGQVYSFPFNFQVPEGTGTSRVGGYKDGGDVRWNVGPHILPPTFSWGKWEDKPNNASVDYGVTVRLICPGVGTGRKGGDPISDTARVLFQQSNPYINAPLSIIRHSKNYILSSSSLADQNITNPGFRQRIYEKFSHDTPTLGFEIGIEVPDLLTAGQEFTIKSTLCVLNKSENVMFLPPIVFTVQKIELLNITFLRASRDRKASSMMMGRRLDGLPTNTLSGLYDRDENQIFEEERTTLNAIPESKTVQVTGIPGHCEVLFTARVPSTTTPSFQCFAISRVYRLKFKLGVEMGRKKFESVVESYVRSLESSL